MIQPVICEVFSQRESVRRLVQYCKELDGTEIKVVSISPEEDAAFHPEHPDNAQACRAAFSLHKAALAMKGQSFIWLEHDSVPLKSGWARKLSSEYKRLKKPFMLSSDTHPPHDLIGGIGVYGPDTHWMIPQHFRREPNRGIGWDLWMIRTIPQLISRTAAIQHSYGLYDESGHATAHRFPRDAHIIRPNAVIFHADKNHDLMRSRHESASFYHSGDLGDIIYHLEIIRRMGGGRLILGPILGSKGATATREPMTPERFSLIKALASAQPYISSVEYSEALPNDPQLINLNLFRETLRGGQSLYREGLRHVGLQSQDETKPWLNTPETDVFVKPIIVARSPRYHRESGFPWKEIVKRYREKIMFIGLIHEFQAFCSFGSVEYCPTANLLEAAAKIKKASLFIGNQSCPYAIAEGLKKPAIQETWQQEPNCLFTRPNVLNRTSDWPTIRAFIDRIIDSSVS